MKTPIRWVAVFLGIGLTTTAHAAVISIPTDRTFTEAQLDTIPEIQVPAFDPSLGALQSAAITFAGMITPGALIFTDQPFSDPVTLTPYLHFELFSASVPTTGFGPLTITVPPEQSLPTTDVAKIGAPENFSQTFTLSNAFVTAALSGATIGVQVNSGSGVTVPPSAGVESDQEGDTSLVARFTVSYTYTAVPEPSSLALLTLPLLGLFMARRYANRP